LEGAVGGTGRDSCIGVGLSVAKARPWWGAAYGYDMGIMLHAAICRTRDLLFGCVVYVQGLGVARTFSGAFKPPQFWMLCVRDVEADRRTIRNLERITV
jgi:hypothetical protein